MARVALLIETAQGATVAVVFPSVDAARDWEDANDVTALGVAPIVTRTEAKAESAN